MFHDLNIRRPDSDLQLTEFKEMLETLKKDGYKCVAITTELLDSVFTSSSKAKKGKQKSDVIEMAIPSPLDLTPYSSSGLLLLNRVNILVSDTSVFHKVAVSRSIKEYDLLSYQPANPAVLKAISGMTDFDILSYNPMIDRPALSFNRKLYNQFVNNGIYMELPYASTIIDATCRKYLIFMAHVYHAVGGSANVIITSGAYSKSQIRSSYDVITTGPIFGLSEEHAKQAIASNCAKCILNAKTRRRGRSTVEMLPFSNLT